MTSEICIMNRRALVLAADSAVTVTRWESGQRQERYFKGSNKVFELSVANPVGIMIFDSADLNRVPWEIIVKAYRAEKGRESCGTIADYASSFFDFIRSSQGLFPDEFRTEVFVNSADQAMIRYLRLAGDDDRVKAAGADAVAADAARRAVLSEFLDGLRALPLSAPFSDQDLTEALGRHMATLLTEAEVNIKYFGQDTTFPAAELVEIGLNAVFKRPEFALSATGIVVAGYGDSDYFPSYQEYVCYGFVSDHLYSTPKSNSRITHQETGHWNTFATTNMVDTFTMGFGPDVWGSVRSHLVTTLQAFAAKIQAELGGSCASLDKLIADALKEHTDNWTDAVVVKHARPLRDVISSLPVDEMASLAETMIMLESLKERVTQPSESVSGPIDVDNH